METKDQTSPIEVESFFEKLKKKKINYWKWIALALIVLFLFTQVFEVNFSITPKIGSAKKQSTGQNQTTQSNTQSDNQQVAGAQDTSALEAAVLPESGVTLPVKWGDLGKKMIEAGVIDQAKFEAVYAQRGGLDEASSQLLTGSDNGNITINVENSGFVLNLLWALGLANKNDVLDKGPMQDPQYGGAGGFASTGGWTLAKGDAMEHYSKHALVQLTPQQQQLVENVSKSIYRPCCGNSTYFPDCNHGMAMLGLLELLASQGVSEQDMYKAAMYVNAYWFPSTYVTIAKLFDNRGVQWSDVDPKTVLGSAYSSSTGYQQVVTEVEPQSVSGGGGCGV